MPGPADLSIEHGGAHRTWIIEFPKPEDWTMFREHYGDEPFLQVLVTAVIDRRVPMQGQIVRVICRGQPGYMEGPIRRVDHMKRFGDYHHWLVGARLK